MNSYRKTEIEHNSAEFRAMLGIHSAGISNIFDACNRKYLLIRYPLGQDGISGAAIYKDGDYIVFSNSSQVLSREIFTVAHELGHIRLGHVGVERQVIQDATMNGSSLEETEADYFAACFLMPKDKTESFVHFQLPHIKRSGWTLLDVAAVMSAFSVSFDTAVNRLNAIGLLSQTQYEQLLSQKGENKVSNLLRAIGVEPDLCFAKEQKSIPVEFLQWACANYSQGLIPRETLEKAVSYLDAVTVDDLGVTPPEQEDDFDLDAFLEDDE